MFRKIVFVILTSIAAISCKHVKPEECDADAQSFYPDQKLKVIKIEAGYRIYQNEQKDILGFCQTLTTDALAAKSPLFVAARPPENLSE